MPEKTQKRKLRSDQSTSQIDEEIASSTNDENVLLSERDFEDISSKVENGLSKRLRDTEVNQREILKLIENLSSKVDNLTSVNPGQNFSTLETEMGGNPNDELEEVEPARSFNSNTLILFFSLIYLYSPLYFHFNHIPSEYTAFLNHSLLNHPFILTLS